MKQINLLPWRQQTYKRKKRYFRFILISGWCVSVGLLGLGVVLLDYRIKTYNLRKNQYLSDLSALSLTMQKTDQLKQQVGILQNELDTLQTKQAHIRKILMFLADLNDLVPTGLFIKIIEYHEASLRLFGSVDSNKKCFSFINTLQLKYKNQLTWDFIKNKENVSDSWCEFLMTLAL